MGTRSVVVTGCSCGIGAACVELLLARGWRVFAGVRREADAARLRAAGATPLRLDVRSPEQVAAAAAEVTAALGGAGLQGLVNNAGIAVPGPLEHLPIARFERQLEVNLTGVLRVGQAFLPLLRTGRGRMVNLSSMAGRLAGPMLGAYHASKWGLEGLSDSWRRELRPQGLWVALVEPGVVRSEIWERSRAEGEEILAEMPEDGRRRYGPLVEATEEVVAKALKRVIPPDRVAEAVRHALEARRPRTRYLVGRDAQLLVGLARLLPDRWVDRLMLLRRG